MTEPLLVETPILRQEQATQRRRTAATVPAIIALVAAAPLLIKTWTPGPFGVLLLGGLVVPAVLTLVRLRQPPPGTRQLSDRGTSGECHLIERRPRPPRP